MQAGKYVAAYLGLILLLMQFVACKACKEDAKESVEKKEDSSYKYNGVYCAFVTYYNPKTKFDNAYALNVEIENNFLKRIIFPQGGWLDETHFTPQEFKDQYGVYFTTFDGKSYTIKLDFNQQCSEETRSPLDDQQPTEPAYSYENKFIVFVVEGKVSVNTYSPGLYLEDNTSSKNIITDPEFVIPRELSLPIDHYIPPSMKTVEYPVKRAIKVEKNLLVHDSDRSLSETAIRQLELELHTFLYFFRRSQLEKYAESGSSSGEFIVEKSYYEVFDSQLNAEVFFQQQNGQNR